MSAPIAISGNLRRRVLSAFRLGTKVFGSAIVAVAAWTAVQRSASAQEPAESVVSHTKPRAAVLVSAEPRLDPFVKVFAYEVAAGVLQQAGYVVAPPKVASTRLTARETDALACAADDRCVRAIASDLHAPSLVFFALERLGPRSTVLRSRTVVLTTPHLLRSAASVVRGRDARVAQLARTTAQQLLPSRAPCEWRMQAAAPGAFSVDAAARQALLTGTLFFAPGDHRLQVWSGAQTWRGSVACRPGRRYRVAITLKP